MSPVSTTTTGDADAATRVSLDELRAATAQLFAAERRLRSRRAAPGELTHAHIRSLRALSEGPLTAGQLARSADLNPASVTAMLDHLERDGIVQRTRSTTDRRVCNVALTAIGRGLLQAKTASWKARWADHLDDYDGAELAIAERVIRDVAGIFDSVLQDTELPAREAPNDH